MASTFKRRSKPSPLTTSALNNATTSSSSSSMLGLRGTKPWTGGTTLTSSGLRDLDGILGGGQPLGTALLVEEDRWTQSLAASLVRYWSAEAVSQGQHLMVPAVDADDAYTELEHSFPAEEEGQDDRDQLPGATKSDILQFLDTLPRNLHWDKQHKAQQQQDAGNNNASNSLLMMETLEEDEEAEEEEDDDEVKNDEGLKIAWQYRKNVQRKRLGGHDASTKLNTSSSRASDVYCHSYDLSGRLSEQVHRREENKTLEETAHIVSGMQCCDNRSSCRAGRSCGFRLYQRLLTQLEMLLVGGNQQPRKVVRLLLYHYKPEILCVALPLLLTQIRLRQLPVVVMASVQPWKSASTASHSKALLALQRASDVVLQTEGFAARSLYPPPPEFRHLHGLLLIRKVSTVTAATSIGGGHYADLTMSKRPPANIYGLKRDRRKLHIPLLHIPPEDHAEGGGSVGGGGVRSGAGRPASASKPSGGGCGSGNQNSALDF